MCFAGKADKTKLPPIIAFKGTKRETDAIDKDSENYVIASSPKAWVNTELTRVWVNKIIGTLSGNFIPKFATPTATDHCRLDLGSVGRVNTRYDKEIHCFKGN